MLGNSGLDSIPSKSYKSKLGTRFTVSAQSTKIMSSASDQRIRHVAIVLQSLDAATSRGLLGQLPPAQSKLVRQAMVRLGTVTPQERESAFQSVQGLLSAANIKPETSPQNPQANLSPAAALLASQQAAIADQVYFSPEAIEHGSFEPNQLNVGLNAQNFASGGNWRHMPAEALSEILQGERPIVIATVMNQVSVERATAIAQSLPMQVAAATLAALPHLHMTDAAVLDDIQLELERKIGQYQTPKQASTEGLAKLQAILASMPNGDQENWTRAVAQSNPMLAAKMGWSFLDQLQKPASVKPNVVSEYSKAMQPTAARMGDSAYQQPVSAVVSSPVVTLSQDPPKPYNTTRSGNNDDIFDESMILPFAQNSQRTSKATESNSSNSTKLADAETKQVTATASSPTDDANRQKAMEDLLKLSDKDFVAVLHACQPQNVLLALSGATKAFLTRVERLMPTKDVKRLRERLNGLGPIQLRDVDAAQVLISETATKLLAGGRIGATSSISFIAAA